MKIDVRNTPEGHSEVTCDSDLESVKADLPAFSDKVKCRAEIDRCGPQIFLHVWYSGTFTIDCSRCLEAFKMPLSGELRLVLKEQPGRSGPSQDEDAVDFYFDSQDDFVDISPAIYDEIMISVPIKPLCSEECKGIRIEEAKSGEDQTKEKEIDPRWEALMRLKKK
ncbi:MAG: DUF177 domain-containing protein [Fibrobacter sp.]|nr:DUF177 domain-containing protein [Fibrobacter sp.]